MKLGGPLALALLFWGGAAFSQQLSVRSGDHSTFSRITLPLPETQSWSARQTEKGVELDLPDFKGSLSTEDVFLRMQRNRITDIQFKAGTLSISVACACIATAFRSGGLLVIDVADEGTRLSAAPLAGPAIIASPRPQRAIRTSGNSGVSLPWIGGNSPFAIIPQSEKTDSAQNAVRNLEISDRAALLDDVQENLVQEVANAASIGLLESSYQAPPLSDVPAPEPSNPAALEPRPLPEAIESMSRNMRVTSSLDFPDGVRRNTLDATTSGMTCPQDDFLAIQSWGTEDGFSAQVGPARNALMNARDHLDAKAASDLAKLYLYFGFGAEALNTLRLDPSLSKDNPHLNVIADIMEYGAAKQKNTLSQFTDCDSDIALWATVSMRDIPSGTLIKTDAVLRALNKLPQHLRQIVAPTLSNRLLQYGDPASAAAAMRSIERLPDALPPTAVMAQAKLAIDSGEDSEPLLEAVIETNTTDSPEALVTLVEGKLARDETLSYETATLVEAYAQELRGTPMGNQLRKTQVIALSQSEHFREAFAALDELLPSLSPDAAINLRQTILEQLTKKAGDIEFLEQVFDQKKTDIAALTVPAQLMIAERMMDLGFAAQTQDILNSVTDRPRNAPRQILAARAALSLEQPFQAQAALIGIEGAEAALLLAQAKEQAGSYSEASEIFSRNDADEQANAAAWLAEDWNMIEAQSSAEFASIATLAQSPNQPDNNQLGLLGQADRALDESMKARETLEQLLNDPLMQVADR